MDLPSWSSLYTDRRFSDVYHKIVSLESLSFSSDGFYRSSEIERISKLYQTYELSLESIGHLFVRPFFQLQTTTYNSHDDLVRMIESLEKQLSLFHYPARLICLIIVDDSDDLDTLNKNRLFFSGSKSSFSIKYYGPDEQKVFLHDIVSASYLPSLLEVFSKTYEDYCSKEITKWGHKGVAGSMNMAFSYLGLY